MITSEKAYLHALASIPGIGAQKIKLLSTAFRTFEEIWHATPAQLEDVGLSQKLTAALCVTKTEASPLENWKCITESGIDLLTWKESTFPLQFSECPNPPLYLYARGDINILSEKSVAIVGSRKHSSYGKQTAMRLSQDLSEAGVHIVSGLALGIDAIAHEATLGDGSGKTIAVLGGGIDDASITPRTNAMLATRILKNGGCLLSEYPPSTPPSVGTFPARNRIMAALAHATLVIEAAHDSGTLITATHAQEFNRPVFAVPGSIFLPEAVGTNSLISEGNATLVQTARDILTALDISQTESDVTQKEPSTDAEKEICNVLEEYSEGLPIDKLIRATTLEGSTVASLLVTMELDGFVTNIGGGNYVRS